MSTKRWVGVALVIAVLLALLLDPLRIVYLMYVKPLFD